MDEFDRLWNTVEVPSANMGGQDLFAALWETTPAAKPPQPLDQKIASGILTAANAALLGFGDEIGAAGSAAIGEAKEALGFGQPATFSERYQHFVGAGREGMAHFAEENPKTALGLEIGGALATGGATAAKTGVFKTPSLLRAIGRGAAVGGVEGAIAGAGYADDAERRGTGAAQGLALGSIFGAGVGTVSGAISKLGRTRTASKLRSTFKDLAENEVGAVGNVSSRSPEKITNAQKQILKIFDSATDEELLTAARRIEEAQAKKIPLTLFEALDVPQGYMDAKAIRGTRGGRDVAEKFLQERRKNTAFRIGEILDDISPEDDIYIGSRQLGDAAEGIVETAERGRTRITKPLYEKAASQSPTIDSEKVLELLDADEVKSAVQRVKSRYSRELGHLPDNHFQVLDAVKKEIDDLRGNALAKGEKNHARYLAKTKADLVNEIDSFSPAYQEARRAYQGMSKPIDWLKGSKYGDQKQVGLLQDLLGTNPEKAGQAANRLMQKSPTQLQSIKEVFAASGKTAELKAGIRAAFQDSLERTNTGVLDDKGGAIIDRIFGKNNTRRKLEALIGKTETDEIFKKVDLEGLVAKGESLVGVDLKAFGSNTTPLKETLGEHRGWVRILLQRPMNTVGEVFENLKPGENERLSKELAEALFKTPDPVEFKRLINIQRQYNAWVRGVDEVKNIAQGAGTRAGSGAAGQYGKPKDELFALGGAGIAGTAIEGQDENIFNPAAEDAAQDEGEGDEKITKSNILWKPSSENDGKLVVLYPKAVGNITIRDAETGKVLDVGQSTGPSNGYGDTVRFNKPGRDFKNVIIEDGNGNELFVDDGARRDENLATKRAAGKSKSRAGGLPKDSDSRMGFLSPTSTGSLYGSGGKKKVNLPSEITGSLLDAVRRVESGGGKYLKSHAGAEGPYQFMPATAKSYGLDDPYDEDKARAAAKRLLADEKKALGSIELALAAYNAGRPMVLRAIKKAGTKNFAKVSQFLPKETREYVPKVAAAMKAQA